MEQLKRFADLVSLEFNQMGGLGLLYNEISSDNIITGKKIAVYLHGTVETAIFIYYLKMLGADVYFSSCNPLSLQLGMIDYLKSIGVNVISRYGETVHDISNNIGKIFEIDIDFLVDDGCALVSYLIDSNINHKVIGASEQTTWGVSKCKNILQEKTKLDFPIIAVNSHKTKHEFDNGRGVSSSTISSIINEFNISFSGKKVLIFGYGNVGRGLAVDLKNLGAKIMISEVSYLNALKAFYDGMEIGSKQGFLPYADICITCTGGKHVVDEDDFKLVKDRCILINIGHSNVEINIQYLYNNSTQTTRIKNFIEEISIFDKKIYLISEGRVANLVLGNGNPPEIMDLTFMNQLYAVYFGIKNSKKLNLYNLNNLSDIFDEKISELKLASQGIKIDQLTDVQREYKKQWMTQV